MAGARRPLGGRRQRYPHCDGQAMRDQKERSLRGSGWVAYAVYRQIARRSVKSYAFHRLPLQLALWNYRPLPAASRCSQLFCRRPGLELGPGPHPVKTSVQTSRYHASLISRWKRELGALPEPHMFTTKPSGCTASWLRGFVVKSRGAADRCRRRECRSCARPEPGTDAGKALVAENDP